MARDAVEEIAEILKEGEHASNEIVEKANDSGESTIYTWVAKMRVDSDYDTEYKIITRTEGSQSINRLAYQNVNPQRLQPEVNPEEVERLLRPLNGYLKYIGPENRRLLKYTDWAPFFYHDISENKDKVQPEDKPYRQSKRFRKLCENKEYILECETTRDLFFEMFDNLLKTIILSRRGRLEISTPVKYDKFVDINHELEEYFYEDKWDAKDRHFFLKWHLIKNILKGTLEIYENWESGKEYHKFNKELSERRHDFSCASGKPQPPCQTPLPKLFVKIDKELSQKTYLYTVKFGDFETEVAISQAKIVFPSNGELNDLVGVLDDVANEADRSDIETHIMELKEGINSRLHDK